MTTLILNGSARPDGDVAALIEALRSRLNGDVLELSPRDGVSPCTDCRACWARRGCAIDDAMRPVYPFYEAADNLVLASPVWFSALSGPLMDLAGRLAQPYFAARRFRGETPAIREKRGVLLLAAGNEKSADIPAAATARAIFRSLRAEQVALAASLETDRRPAAADEAALGQARSAAELLNRLHARNG